MLTESQKLDNFHAAIAGYALEQRTRIESEISELTEKQLHDTESLVLEEAYRLIQKEMTDMRRRISKEMSARETEIKKELIEKREQITSEVFLRAKAALCDFAKSEKYESYLSENLKKLPDSLKTAETEFFVAQKDLSYATLIRSLTHTEVKVTADPSITVGGFCARNQAVYADATLDTALSSQLPWFEEHSGLSVV